MIEPTGEPIASSEPDLPSTPPAEVSTAPGPSRGARLRAAREAAGLGQAELAARLRLSLRQVQALEDDEEAALPPPPFVRGFVRNYARALGRDPLEFDPPPAVRAVPEVEEPLPSLAPPVPQRPIPLESGRASANRRWLISALIALLLGAAGSWVRLEHLDAAGNLLARQAAGPLNAIAGWFSSSRSTAPVSSGPPAGTEPVASPAGTLAAGTPAGVDGPQTGTSAASPPPGEAAPAVAVNPAGGEAATAASLGAATGVTRTLALDFDADSWVEVRDETGQVLLSGVSRAGDHRNLEVRGPLRIVVGNAPATRLSWNGRPIDLAEFTRVTVARLTLDPAVEHP